VNYLTVSADPLPFPPTLHKSPIKTPLALTHSFPLSAISPIPGDELFHISAAITPNIAYYLPRNVDLHEIAQLAPELDSSVVGLSGTGRKREWVEVEEAIVGDRVKAVTAYYGSLIVTDEGG
jgi:trimethylguanosine synthase